MTRDDLSRQYRKSGWNARDLSIERDKFKPTEVSAEKENKGKSSDPAPRCQGRITPQGAPLIIGRRWENDRARLRCAESPKLARMREEGHVLRRITRSVWRFKDGP